MGLLNYTTEVPHVFMTSHGLKQLLTSTAPGRQRMPELNALETCCAWCDRDGIVRTGNVIHGICKKCGQVELLKYADSRKARHAY